MKLNAVLVVFVLAVACGQAAAASPSFTAATAQHAVVAMSSGMSATDLQMANLEAYATNALQAMHSGAQIVAFPEFGLFESDFNSKCSKPSDMAPYCEPVPLPNDPRGVPCDNPSAYADSPVVVATSCMAKNASIIVAVNMCQFAAGGSPSDDKYYNTELVVSESGAVLAVYRKSHVWYTKCFDEPATPDLVTFNASFGVEFGLFTCYDILFSTPGPALQKQGVRHFITSAAIPIVGSTADKFWSWKYGSALIASDLQMGQSGVFVKGSMLTSKMPSSGDAVKLASVPKSI